MPNFFAQFLKNPRNIGAIAPSSRFLADKMMAPIDFSKAQCIVEFGSGSGAFTRELVRRKRPETTLICMEMNPAFCAPLQQRYGAEPNVHILEVSAARVNEELKRYGFSRADCIVSGLPFTSMTADVTAEILTATQEAMGVEGMFITFQYSMVKKRLFLQYFDITASRWELRNLPPAHALVMRLH